MQFLAGSNNEHAFTGGQLSETITCELLAQKLIHITVYISYYIIILPAVGIQILPGYRRETRKQTY